MQRDLAALASCEHDLIIVGGGIYGAWAAWDASLRGLKVALLDKDDFGGATSSNSLKIIHGGLRYLQHADLRRMRESIRERRILMRVAPQFVHPLPCVMPTYGHGVKGREAMAVALALNDIVSFDRNRQSAPQKILPRGRVLTREALLEILPGLDETGLTGGALWYDCQVSNSERLLITLLKGASLHQAELANYAAVTGFLRTGSRVHGVAVQDKLSGKTHEVRGKLVLNTCGPWINSMLDLVKPGQKPVSLSKAMNLVVRRQLIPQFAAGVPSKFTFKDADAVLNAGSRLLFFAPWRQYTLIGTTHLPYDGKPENFQLTENDVSSFLQEFNDAYPAMAVGRDDISFAYGGLLPMEPETSANGDVTLTKKYMLRDHAKQDDIEGVISALGVKYTTARDVAVKAVNLAARKLRCRKPTRTLQTRLPGGRMHDFRSYEQAEMNKRAWGLSREVVSHLVYNYGTRYADVLQLLETDAALAQRPSEQEQVIAAEVLYAIREEQAQTLSDVIRRRTELGAAGWPGREAVNRVLDLMSGELGWDASKQQQEVEALENIYRLSPALQNETKPERAAEPAVA